MDYNSGCQRRLCKLTSDLTPTKKELLNAMNCIGMCTVYGAGRLRFYVQQIQGVRCWVCSSLTLRFFVFFVVVFFCSISFLILILFTFQWLWLFFYADGIRLKLALFLISFQSHYFQLQKKMPHAELPASLQLTLPINVTLTKKAQQGKCTVPLISPNERRCILNYKGI